MTQRREGELRLSQPSAPNGDRLGCADRCQRGEGTVGKLLTDDQLYNNFNQLSSEAVKLIYDFRQNPKKYLTVKFELF